MCLYNHFRLIRFVYRLKNQWRIHGYWAKGRCSSIWFVIKMSWAQSKWKQGEKVFNDIEKINITDL